MTEGHHQEWSLRLKRPEPQQQAKIKQEKRFWTTANQGLTALKETILDEEQNSQSDKESQTRPQFIVQQTINLEPIQSSTSGLQQANQMTTPELAPTTEVDVADRPITPQQDKEANSAVIHKRSIF